MPTYEYICENCGNHYDQFQGMNDDPLDQCPECGSIVKRVISGGTGFIMKDGGTRNLGDTKMKPACGQNQTCCGRDYTCGKPGECHE